MSISCDAFVALTRRWTMISLRQTGQMLSNATRAWVLAVALLLTAQTISVIHDLDPQNTQPDHVCEICHLGAHLDHGLIADAPSIEYRAQAVDPIEFSYPALRRFRAVAPPARGPPTVS